jgi:hypothetical protein
MASHIPKFRLVRKKLQVLGYVEGLNRVVLPGMSVLAVLRPPKGLGVLAQDCCIMFVVFFYNC